MDGITTNSDALIDILVFSSPEEIQQIKLAYSKQYGMNSEDVRKLEADVEKETSGDFKRVLLEILKVNSHF